MKKISLKIMLLAVGCWLLASGTAQAQEVTDLKVIKIAKDTTYKFCEVQTKDGDTIGLRYFPQSPLKKDAFINFTIGLANQETERLKEFKRLQRAVQKNIDFLASQVDSIGGAGTYASQQHQKLKQAMQGAWTLIERREGKEPDITTVVVQEDNMSSKDKTSGITWTNGETFRLKSGGIYAFNLDFKQDGDRYVAERTNQQGVLVKYILKR